MKLLSAFNLEMIGYTFEITTIKTHTTSTYPFERTVKETDGVSGYQTRQEARTAAIEKLDELITIPLGGNGLKE